MAVSGVWGGMVAFADLEPGGFWQDRYTREKVQIVSLAANWRIVIQGEMGRPRRVSVHSFVRRFRKV